LTYIEGIISIGDNMSTPPDNLSDLQNESYRYTPQLSNPGATAVAVVNPDGSTISGGGGGGGDVNITEVGGNPVTTSVPVSATTLPLPTGASTSANQTTEIANLATIATNQTNGSQQVLVTDVLVPKVFDSIKVTATDASDNPTTIQYLTGGLSGTVVATLTITYDASENFATVTRS
jgi:hypothetical protein